MSKHQDITFGVTGQSLYWDCPEGTPSSITSVTVYRMEAGDDTTAESATTGSPSIDLVSTTVDAASGYGQTNPRLVNLTSTANINIGQHYVLIAADSEREWIEPVSIDSGVSITARHPLQNTYASGDTFKGVRINQALDSTWVSTTSKLTDGPDPNPGYRVRWVYVVNGFTCVHDGYFDLVRYAGTHSLLPTDIESMYPDFRDQLPTYHRIDEGRRLLADSAEDVRFELLANGVDDASVRDVDAMNRAILLRFGMRMARWGTDPEVLRLATEDYDNHMNKIFRIVARVKQAADTGGGGNSAIALGIAGR